jgi:signal transduction histidine kinase
MAPSQDVSFLSTLLPLAGIVFIIAVGVVILYQHFRKNLYRQMLEQEELKNRHHHDLLRSSIEVQEEERKRIAQDMHDELGASLSIARMHLLQLERQYADQGEIMQKGLTSVRSLIETALSTMRRISHELMPPQLETFGLVKTLEDVALQLNQINGIKLKVEVAADIPRLSWNVTLGMYRVIMELINNTLKHAEASEIGIAFCLEEGCFTFTYSDNGKGLPVDGFYKGLGHKNAEARINSMGGHFTLDNEEATGFKIVIRIPVNS